MNPQTDLPQILIGELCRDPVMFLINWIDFYFQALLGSKASNFILCSTPSGKDSTIVTFLYSLGSKTPEYVSLLMIFDNGVLELLKCGVEVNECSMEYR